MNSSRKTQGVTLVLTVLIVMVVLAAIVAATSTIALSARRTSADQTATLRSQYVAESGVARAQARITLINAVINSSSDSNGKQTGGILVPDGTSSLVIQSMISSLCGVATLPTQGIVCGQDGSKGNTTNILAGITDLATSNRLVLFNTYISPATISGAGYAVTASTEPAFWAQTFGGANGAVLNNNLANSSDASNGSFTSSIGLNLIGVRRDATEKYSILLSIPDTSASGKVGTAQRNVKIESPSKIYTLTVARDSFAKFALFTNHHFSDAASEAGCITSPNSCSRITFTSNTLFSGPVHTNEVFNFTGSPYFAGPVTSAGCSPGSITTTNGADSCSNYTQGAYAQGSNGYSGYQNFTSASTLGTNTAPTMCAYPSAGVCSNPTYSDLLTTPKFQGSVRWDSPFQQLPANGNDQVAAAKSGGLYINGVVSNMKLSVDQITPQGGIQEKMQLITYTSPSGASVQLATNKNKDMFILVNGQWKPAVQLGTSVKNVGDAGAWVDKSASGVTALNTSASSFNGVVFAQAPTNSDGTVQTSNGSPVNGITNLNGPDRTPANATTSTSANTPPSVADFMQLNVVSNGNVHVTSDLTYEAPPCSGGNTVVAGVFSGATCDKLDATNILGVYSSEGDVDLNSPAKYTSSNEGMPANAKIQAVLMASKGKVTVDGYAAGNASDGLGQVHLLGGLIENYYGAFGLTSGNGYGRDFVYDPRTAQGVLPPSFPTLKTWGSILDTPLKLTSGTQVQQSNSP